jgi:hypothetical protein
VDVVEAKRARVAEVLKLAGRWDSRYEHDLAQAPERVLDELLKYWTRPISLG